MRRTLRLFTVLSLLVSGSVTPVSAADFEHQLDVELQPASGEIRIKDHLEVTGIEEFRFRLAAWLTYIDVKVDGKDYELVHRDSGSMIVLPDSGAHLVEFDLRGRLPPRDVHNVRDLTSSSAEDGTYLPGYDDWIPHPVDALMHYQLRVTVPAAQRVVATGKLVDEKIGDDVYQASFSSTRPAEAPSLFAGPYRVEERIWQGLRLRTYFHAEVDAQAATYLDAATTFIDRYQNIIGDYPYADFHIVSAPLPVGLGFPSLTYVDRRILPLPFMRSRSLAHEVLHSWWGNAVAVEYSGGNWAEGLTTYLADYALAADQGEEQARTMRIKWLRDYAALPQERDHPVTAFRSKQHDAAQVIGYNKVAFIFHMLQREIGEQAFNGGLREFWRRHKFGRAGWRDLQAAFEQAAERRLDWFFRQWLDQAGAPRPSVGGHWVEEVEGGYRTRIEILQPVSGYQFSFDALLQTDSGVERRRLFIEDSLTRVEWITPGRPLSIHFDPQSDLFRRLQPGETPPILRDITLNSASITLIADAQPDFIDAARALAERLLDNPKRFLAPGQSPGPAQPLLLITSAQRLDEQLERLQLKLPADLPADFSGIEHGAAVWTARLANNTPVLVVSATSTAELQAILRPLPHYGGQSYVLFDSGRALSRGLWPLSRGALYRDLSGGS
jgi:aminopeptidase N